MIFQMWNGAWNKLQFKVLGGPSPVALKVYSGFLGLVYFSGL